MLTVLWQTKTMVSFPLEDKHVVNEHHIVQKSHEAIQKRCPHVVHGTMIGFKQTHSIKNVTLKTAKKNWV